MDTDEHRYWWNEMVRIGNHGIHGRHGMRVAMQRIIFLVCAVWSVVETVESLS